MKPLWLSIPTLLLLAICGPAGSVGAQQPAASAPTGPTATAPQGGAPPLNFAAPAAGMLEAKPEVFYFRNEKTGLLQPVVGFSLEMFEEMLKQREAAAGQNRRPDYRFDSITATGSADDRYARLDVKFIVYLDADGWVRVPLDLQGSVLEKYADYKGSGKFALQYDTERREYVAWLQGKGDKPHELTLKTYTPLEQVAGQLRLRLSVPRAWSSALSLTVSQANVVAQASPGTVLGAVEKQQKQSIIKATGVGGAFQLTWGAAENAARKLQVLLEAKADLLATVDGRSVAYETEMTVNSFGGEFDRFQVQLPPSSVLVEEELADLELTKLAPRDKNDKTTVYEVRRTSGPVNTLTVKLKALRSLEQTQGQSTFNFGGFEVLNAVRQWGYLGVVLEDDWQIQWLDLNRIRQVDDAPEFLAGRTVASVFEYFGRPFTLQARIAPRETRVSIDPEYTVNVTPQRVFLQAKLKYRVGGAKVFSFAVDLPDWQVDEVGPAEIVDSGAVVLGQTAPLAIPLLQPSAGEFEVTLRAHRDLAAGAKEVAFTLPRPRANVVGPATLIVQAAENVELSPRDSLHTGLVRRKRGDGVQRDRGGTAWSYAVDATEAKFAADMRPLARSVHVNGKTRLTLTREGGDAVQKFSYLVAREPIDALSFDVPARLTDKGRLELSFEGKPVPWVVVDEDAGAEKKPVRIRVNLPAAQQGAFQLEAKYPLPEELPVAQASVALQVPLLAPTDGELVENELAIASVPGLTVQHVDAAWRKGATQVTPDGAHADLTYISSTATPETMLGVRWDDPAPVYDVVVERLWIQSVVAAQSIQERAVYRLHTAAAGLELQLPAGASGLIILLDGSPWDVPEAGANGAYTLRLPPAAGSRDYVLDIRYRKPRNGDGLSVTLDAPTIEHVQDLRYVYRQVVLPNDECLVHASSDYVPEFSWTWRDLFLVRRPLLAQSDLETWCGARHETAIPERANVYLYSGFGATPLLEVSSARRTTIVLLASGAVLLYCLGLLYFEPLRRPALIVVSAVGVSTLGVLYPDAAPLALQAAALGGVLSFAAVLLDRNVTRRRGRSLRQVVEPPSAAGISSTKTRITAAYAPPPMSTAAVDAPGSAAPSGNAT